MNSLLHGGNELNHITIGDFFSDVHNQKAQLEEIIIQWRAYKEEYERLSDWLQQIEDAIKLHKTTLFSNVSEKENQVAEVQVHQVRNILLWFSNWKILK